MNKIVIIGPSGVGKSHFAKRLGNLLGIKVFHLDKYYWKPNWQKIGKASMGILRPFFIVYSLHNYVLH